MAGLKRLPDDEELGRVVNAEDELAMVVRSHQCIEAALDSLILEALPYRHEKLMLRLPFIFKVDLSIALFAIDPATRPAIISINKIRNQFAHNLFASISEQDAKDLFNSTNDVLRLMIKSKFDELPSPAECFRRVAACLYIYIRHCCDTVADSRLWLQATAQVADEVLKPYSHLDVRNNPTGTYANIMKKFDILKAQRAISEL